MSKFIIYIMLRSFMQPAKDLSSSVDKSLADAPLSTTTGVGKKYISTPVAHVVSGARATVIFISHLVTSPSASKLNKFQIDFDVAGLPPRNNFDEYMIDISVNFRSRHGTSTTGKTINRRVNAFWSIDFVRNASTVDPTGYVSPPFDPHINIGDLRKDSDPNYLTEKSTNLTPWHVRFAPPETGEWDFDFRIVRDGLFIAELPGGSFKVLPSDNKGYIQASDRNFRFSNGDLFYAIGVHANWNGWSNYNRRPFLFVMRAIDEIAENNGNHARLFLTYDKFGIEHELLNNYATSSRQERAFDLDEIIEHAQVKGVYLQLVLEERLDFRPLGVDAHNSWDNNPYRKIDSDPNIFWTNVTSQLLYQQKLRYIIARWGYATSIFAFEFMSEVSLLMDTAWAMSGGAMVVSNWVNRMRNYCKIILGDPHMYTISVTGRASGYPNNPYGSARYDPSDFIHKTNVDFYTDHLYVTSEFQDYRINYLANRARHLYPQKPYIIGEFGLAEYDDNREPLCDSATSTYMYSEHFLSDPSNFVTHNYNAVEFHNALFASLLSGCAGTITNWDDLTNKLWGGQLKYISPLVTFIQGEDLNMTNCIAIRNKCPINLSFKREGFIFPISGEIPLGFDADAYQEENLNNDIFNIKIESNYDKIEVFALKYINGGNKFKIIGWVRNRNNWWYNLPHAFDNTNPSEFPFCSNSSPFVTPLSNVIISIQGIQCNTEYRIDFYSVYPDWPLISGGVPANGGIIGSITALSNCGTLSFTVPGALVVLSKGNGPCAPDYGFKITPIGIKGWGHGLIGARFEFISGIHPFAINGIGTQIAYRGADGSLQCYYRAGADVYSWSHVVLGPAASNGVKVGGAIARGAGSPQIYYHGANDRLQVVFWTGSKWAWGDLTDWSNTSQNVGGDIASNSTGGKIFYRGIDGQLHFYIFDGVWRHSIYFLERFKRPALDANFAVNANGTLIAFKAFDGTLVLVWYDAASATYKVDRRSELVSGMVRTNNIGNVLFYRGRHGILNQLYYEGSAWHNKEITASGRIVSFVGPFDITPECTKDNAQVYFRGPDGFMNVAFMVDGKWTKGPVIFQCSPEQLYKKCRENGYICYANGMVLYEAMGDVVATYSRPILHPITFIQAYYFGKCDTEQR